jgi:hypothetical protein
MGSSSVGASREPAGVGKHPPAHDDLEEIELSLLLEGVFRQYGFAILPLDAIGKFIYGLWVQPAAVTAELR